MKFGVLGFGYDHFENFAEQLKGEGGKGYYTVNLGDNTQSIATRYVYRQAGISDEDMILINRDSLASYDGEKAVLIMNGVFWEWSFPIPMTITPIFIGFHANEGVIRNNKYFFKRHEPIGCRDSATTKLMQSHGISAFTTGCLTLALPPRSTVPTAPKLLVVYGDGGGALPAQVLKYIPAHLADTAEFIFHRFPVSSHPLSLQQCMAVERYERDILEQYRSRATIVLTPLHHACTPAMAMGIPVIVCRNDFDPRFSFLQDLLPIYTPDRFSQINWNQEPVNVDNIRAKLLHRVHDLLSYASIIPRAQTSDSGGIPAFVGI